MAFDVQALRQLADLPIPSDPVELARVWQHVGLDLCAAADEIERLAALAETANDDWHRMRDLHASSEATA